MTDSTLQITLPEQLITNTIRAEMVKQLGGLESVAKQVVIAAMEEPATDRYGHTTKKRVNGKMVEVTRFEVRVGEMIRKEAESVFQEWLDEHRNDIRSALEKHLTAKKNKVLKDLCESLVTNMSSYNVRATLALGDRQDGEP